MANNNDWMEDLKEESTPAMEELQHEEKKRKATAKKSRPGAKGKKPVKGLEIEVGDRAGKRGPLAVLYGQGPRPRVSVNVPISAELRNKLDKQTIGARGQICSLLIGWALEELAAQGKSISASAIK